MSVFIYLFIHARKKFADMNYRHDEDKHGQRSVRGRGYLQGPSKVWLKQNKLTNDLVWEKVSFSLVFTLGKILKYVKN